MTTLMMFSRLCWRPSGRMEPASVSATALSTAARQEPVETKKKKNTIKPSELHSSVPLRSIRVPLFKSRNKCNVSTLPSSGECVKQHILISNQYWDFFCCQILTISHFLPWL